MCAHLMSRLICVGQNDEYHKLVGLKLMIIVSIQGTRGSVIKNPFLTGNSQKIAMDRAFEEMQQKK